MLLPVQDREMPHANGCAPPPKQRRAEKVIARTLALSFVTAMLVAPLTTSATAAPHGRDASKLHGAKEYGYTTAPNGQARDCVATRWSDSANVPLFKCPGDPRSMNPDGH